MTVPDWVDWASATGTVVAAGFAAYALYQGAQQTEAARADRRTDFEVGVLLRLLGELPKGSNVVWRDEQMVDLARTLPDYLIPLTRAACSLDSTPEAYEEVNARFRETLGPTYFGQSRIDANRDALRAELVGAIDTLVRDRPKAPKYHRGIKGLLELWSRS